MNKKGYFIITITYISIIILWVFWIYYYIINLESFNKNIDINIKSNKKNENEEIKTVNIYNAKEKIVDLRKKLELKWLIITWDIHLLNKEYTIALTKYLQIIKEVPNDQNTINKIWDTYFFLKKYKQSYKYYSKIKDYKHLNKLRFINSYLYSNNLDHYNNQNIKDELKNLNLDKTETFYYTNSINCISDLNLCKDNFENYFLNYPSIESWEQNTINKNLSNINKALTNYKNFNIDDTLYKDALLNWAFFENWLYPIAIKLSLDILEKKPNYKPILKIIAKSYFEVWDYLESKIYFTRLLALDDDNAEINFFIWIIYEKMHEYLLSSIHLKKSISLWYKNRINAKKRLIYNYHELWNIDKMLTTFKQIINENKDTISSEDLSLAIFYNILNNKISDAKKFTELGIKKFPLNEIFYWYIWWIKLQENNQTSLKEAEKNLKKWFEINIQNPMLNLIYWKLEEKKWNDNLAISYYKKTINFDNNWEFWKIAKNDLEKLNTKIWILKKIN